VALVPGDPAKSPLIQVLGHDGKIKMPPQGKLPQTAVDTLTRWVAAGAVWPSVGAGQPGEAGKAGASARAVPVDDPARHWSFQPLRRPVAPPVANIKWVRTPVDRFILAALEQKRLTPTAPVDRRKLFRRVTFDLIGLPPAPEEVEKFVRDPDPKAYEKLVDCLLASPQYGERWGRHWLDLARYADSDGQESDNDRPTAYHYRDFVIRALNQDLPYNTFVRWQLAGDEIAPDNPLALSATGFLAAGTHANLDSVPMEEEKVRERYNELDDILSTTGSALLGLTIGCARCHDHKYDPIPTRDYYRLLAAFNAGDRAEVPLLPQAEVAVRRKAESAWREKLDAAKKAGDAAATKALEAAKPPRMPTAFAIADFGAKPRESWLLDRGDFRHRKEPVELGFLSVLCRDKSPTDYWSAARAGGARSDTTYQRRAVADWMTDTEHGAGALLARVMVNRLWQGHFGEGLVRTVNDFGKRSEAPSHPALLEWLASDLVRGGWRLKPLHRMILLSAAYRQGTAFNPRAAKVDPENRLLWRRKLRRVESEIFRDSMLAVAGTLNPERYGKGFKPPIQPEALQARNVKDPYPKNAQDTPETRRRTIYMFHKRVAPYPLLQAFDGPDASAPCGRRNSTTVAPQALAVLNEPFIRLRALEFARRLQAEAGKDATAQVQRAYRLALSREPSARELEASVRFLRDQTAAHAARKPSVEPTLLALADFAHVVFGLNEFLYID
jgi:hypothetical protein